MHILTVPYCTGGVTTIVAEEANASVNLERRLLVKATA